MIGWFWIFNTDGAMPIMVISLRMDVDMKASLIPTRLTVPSTEPVSLSRLWARFRLRQQTRRALLRMTDDQLKDVGLTRQQAEREATLPFWQLLR
ncbi:DUF1127 domain-containing protein [Stutzerimonas azotifigens]